MEELPWRVVYDAPCPEVWLGPHRFDIRFRALVVGIVAGTPDAVVGTAARALDDGADCLEVVAREAGIGSEVDEAEALDRVIPAVTALRARFDLPLSVATSRATVLREALAAGAVAGNDVSGFADPDYLPVAAAAGASVAATCAGPEPAVDAVCRFLRDCGERARAAGIPAERVVVDAGVDRSRTELQSLELLRAHDRIAALGWPLALSTWNERSSEAAPAAHALGISLGARLLRAHDVRAARRTADVLAAVLEARGAPA